MKKENLFFGIACGILFGLFIFGYLGAIDKLDQYKEEATVISVESLDEQIVTFETESGNIFVEYFDYEYEIHPQDKAVLVIKEYENANVADDRVVKVKWVE